MVEILRYFLAGHPVISNPYMSGETETNFYFVSAETTEISFGRNRVSGVSVVSVWFRRPKLISGVSFGQVFLRSGIVSVVSGKVSAETISPKPSFDSFSGFGLPAHV